MLCVKNVVVVGGGSCTPIEVGTSVVDVSVAAATKVVAIYVGRLAVVV